MIAFSPPSASTHRLLDGRAASAASSPGANPNAGDLHVVPMDYAVIGNCNHVLKREAWRVHPPSLPPCQRRRKKICQSQSRKKFSVILNFTNPSTPSSSWETTRYCELFFQLFNFCLLRFSLAYALIKVDSRHRTFYKGKKTNRLKHSSKKLLDIVNCESYWINVT